MTTTIVPKALKLNYSDQTLVFTLYLKNLAN